MIGRLRGVILEKNPPLVLLEAGGVGYEVHMPITSLCKLPDIKKETIIFTYFLIRKDSNLLFGFNNKQERTLFKNLIKVNGIGPKLALIILSSMSTQQFVNAVYRKDFSALVNIPGIGKKTAERLIIEMRDYFKNLDNNLFNSISDLTYTFQSSVLKNKAEQEAVSALVSLGYKYKEASRMVSKITISDANSETLIYEALRSSL